MNQNKPSFKVEKIDLFYYGDSQLKFDQIRCCLCQGLLNYESPFKNFKQPRMTNSQTQKIKDVNLIHYNKNGLIHKNCQLRLMKN